jgi:hypothetical protein
MSAQSSFLDDVRDLFSPEFHAAPLEALYEKTGNPRYKAAADALRVAPSRRGRKSYDDADELTLKSMIGMIVSGSAKGAHEASLLVAPDAAGHGTLESKASRLYDKFRDRNLDQDVAFIKAIQRSQRNQAALANAATAWANEQAAFAAKVTSAASELTTAWKRKPTP